MNKAIAKTMLALSIIFLTGFYVLKFIFPEFLLLQVTDPNIIKLGNFLNSYPILQHTFKILTSILTYYLFVCASRGSFKLKWYEFLYILAGVAICKCVYEFVPELYTHTSIATMFILAMLCKGNLTYSAVSFTIYGFLSQFAFSIRGFETILLKYNLINGLVLMLDCWFWLLTLALIFYLKENKKDGRISTSISK